MLNRWQAYWSGLFFVLLAASASVATAGLASGARRGVAWRGARACGGPGSVVLA